MITLAIRVGSATYYYDPQEDYYRIYNCLTEMAGWCHEDAENAASWVELAYYEEEYDTGDPDVEIFFVEE